MFTITKSGVEIAVTERPTYIRLQSNGAFGLCSREQAQGVAWNGIPYHVEGFPAIDREGVETVVLTEIDGGRRMMQTDKHVAVLAAAGVKQIQLYCSGGETPSAESGVFVDGAEAWEAGKSYERGKVFAYNGAMGYVKQAHTSQDTWLPFTTGTEALYGARPAPDENGIYPYVYNMAADVGMRVRDPDDEQVYTCTQAITDMLYKPHEIPAHFTLDDIMPEESANE